jgi:hypothetical protein
LTAWRQRSPACYGSQSNGPLGRPQKVCWVVEAVAAALAVMLGLTD